MSKAMMKQPRTRYQFTNGSLVARRWHVDGTKGSVSPERGTARSGIVRLTWPFGGGDTGNRTPDLLLAKSRPSRHLPSLSTYAAPLVGMMRG